MSVSKSARKSRRRSTLKPKQTPTKSRRSLLGNFTPGLDSPARMGSPQRMISPANRIGSSRKDIPHENFKQATPAAGAPPVPLVFGSPKTTGTPAKKKIKVKSHFMGFFHKYIRVNVFIAPKLFKSFLLLYELLLMVFVMICNGYWFLGDITVLGSVWIGIFKHCTTTSNTSRLTPVTIFEPPVECGV